MPNHYCPECGEKTAYLSQSPKSCGNCGAVYAPATTPTKIPPQRLNTNTVFLPQGQMYGDISDNEEQKLEELKASVTPFELDNKDRLGRTIQGKQIEYVKDIWGKLGDGFQRGNPMGKKKISNKQIIKDFQREASPEHTRANPIDICPEE